MTEPTDPVRLVEAGAVNPDTPGARLAVRHPRLIRIGYATDNWLNVALLNGNLDEPISLNVARRAGEGARWARWVAWWLNHTVERDHTAKVLRGDPTARPATLRAGAMLMLLMFALWWLIVHALGWLVGGVDALMRHLF